jgi:purine-binding chemotaxis protein CheW
MEPLLEQQGEELPFLVFHVQQQLCAIPLGHVVEIMRPLPVEAISGVPEMVKGAAIIRGTPLPVLDLAALWQGGTEPPRRFITVKAGERRLALAVTSVEGLRTLPTGVMGDIPPLLSGARANAVDALGALDSGLLMVLDASHIVPESVWTAIQNAGEAS